MVVGCQRQTTQKFSVPWRTSFVEQLSLLCRTVAVVPRVQTSRVNRMWAMQKKYKHGMVDEMAAHVRSATHPLPTCPKLPRPLSPRPRVARQLARQSARARRPTGSAERCAVGSGRMQLLQQAPRGNRTHYPIPASSKGRSAVARGALPCHGGARGGATAEARRERAPPLHNEAPGVAEATVPRDPARLVLLVAPPW